MDIGLVCDRCDAFNQMASHACQSCGAPISLGGRRATRKPQPGTGPGVGASRKPAAAEAATARKAGPSTAAGAVIAEAPRAHSSSAAAVPVAPPQTCGQCGATIAPGFRFCGTCGAKVEAPASSKSAPIERRTMFFGAMQAARAKLVLIKGDGLDGVSYTLAGQEHVAGRLEGPLQFPEDPFLSPRHADFFYKEGRLHVRDEGSANGVFVRIRAAMPLRTGDSFLVGEQLLKVETTPPETAGLGPDPDGTYVFASPRRASRMRIVQLLRGGDIGLCHRAGGDVVTLGREGNDINFPDDPFISGRHSQVSFSDAGLMLTDLGSKNGTFLRIRSEQALNHGDYVFMGQQLLRVEIV